MSNNSRGHVVLMPQKLLRVSNSIYYVNFIRSSTNIEYSRVCEIALVSDFILTLQLWLSANN